MKPEVEAKLAAVFRYPFFQSCGGPLPKTVTTAEDWEAAVRDFSSRKWDNCELMARNALFDAVQRKSWEREQEWNPMVLEIRPRIYSFVETLLPKRPVPPQLAAKVRRGLPWPIMFICLEYAYRDLVPPMFYIPVIEPWFAAGHCPCGWDGEEFPEHWDGKVRRGRLIVY
jgi:hypothetical protein